MNPVTIRTDCLQMAIRTAAIAPHEIVGQAGAYEAYITGKERTVAKKAKKAKKTVKKAKTAKK